MTTLQDVLVIPHAEELSALDFVIRLDAEARDESVRRLVADYVVTPSVAEALPVLFAHLHTAVTRGEAYGHVLHGGFGSGKSHLMSVLGLLLDDHPIAWAKPGPAFARLREEHRAWIRRANLLVVRVHMLSARRAGAGLDDVLYEGFNQALAAKGKPPLLVSGAAEVLAEIRKEAADYGAEFWKRADAAGVAAGPEDLALAEEVGEEAVAALAEAFLRMKGRSVRADGLKPAWGEGVRRMARHAVQQGFGGITFLVDEFLLWLAEKDGENFMAAINDMNTFVDFPGRREAPVLVVFARQKNIKEFFPELTNQDRIHERVEAHMKRFEPTLLQEVELRHIVAERVLANKKDPDALRRAVDGLQETYKRALDDLVGEQGFEVLRDVYPFHPALIDVLVDVSNLMQRERSALRLLYELLAHNRTLPLGELLPVGRAFEHVFPPAGVEAAQKAETLQKIHGEWYQRLRPRIDAFVRSRQDDGDPISEERANALRQAVKTVLLGLVSPRLAGKGNERLTVERLVKLNYADADGDALRSKVLRVWGDLRDFQIYFAPELQLTGEKGAAVVSYALGQASLAEVLRRAEEQVGGKNALLAAYGARFEKLLPKSLAGLVATSEGAGLPFEVLWRGTRRRGRVVFGNVRVQKYEVFWPAAGEEFRVVVDYPWDEPGHTFGEDIDLVARVRNKRTAPTAAWLPRHFSVQESRLLRELAAAALLVDGGVSGELLAAYGRDERGLLLEQARNRLEMLQRQVDAALLEAYDAHGEVKALVGARDPDLKTGTLAGDLDQIVRELLDRRYPKHPAFKLEATAARIRIVERWMREAWGHAGSVHFDAETGSVLEHVAKQLELADVGQSRAAIEHHGRFVKEVVAELGDHATMSWTPIAEKLREAPLGLTDEVIDLLLVYVCLKGYRLRESSGERVEPRIGLGGKALTLERAELLDLAPWTRARSLCHQLLHVAAGDAHRSLSAQDRLASEAAGAAVALRDTLQKLHGRLDGLDAAGSDRQLECKVLLEKLAPLVKGASGGDSFTMLTAWLAAWPEEDASLTTALRAARGNLAALDALDTTSRGHLIKARHGRLAVRIEATLAELDERVRAREQVKPLRHEDVERFGRDARRIVHDLIEPEPKPPDNPKPPDEPRPPGVTEEVHTLPGPSEEGVARLIAKLQAALASGELVSAELKLRRRERAR